MLSLPLNRPSRFTFDTSGAIGLVGGDDALSAITAVHVYGNRRWLGWYNNPGSFQIFNQLDSFTKSASSSGIFSSSFAKSSKSVHTDPTVLFGVDRRKGPRFRAAHSDIVIEETGYLAELFMKECTARSSEGKVVPGRKTQPVGITIVDLGQALPPEMHPARSSALTPFSASIPIAVSLGTCTLSAACEDWYAASLIFLGIVASGVSGLVLGSADLLFDHPETAKGSPAGDGILSFNNDIVLLRGTEGAVNLITRSTFSLRFASQGHYYLVRWCSFLFLIQAITQLLLIPQASLFGQVMFLASLGVSALYNSRFSSLDKEKVQQMLLFESVLENPTSTKYMLGTRTTAVVFMLLVLRPQDPTALLNELLPNDTKVWKQWKAMILEWLRHPNGLFFQSGDRAAGLSGFTQEEKELLRHLLYNDGRAAYNAYQDYCGIALLSTLSM